MESVELKAILKVASTSLFFKVGTSTKKLNKWNENKILKEHVTVFLSLPESKLN